MVQIFTCRVYQLPIHKDGAWILVDRLWPRGIRKDNLAIDLWAKDWAPSIALRKWFNHDPEKWEDFSNQYRQELEAKRALIETLLERFRRLPLTLLYAAKDTKHNHALVLQMVLQAWSNLGLHNRGV